MWGWAYCPDGYCCLPTPSVALSHDTVARRNGKRKRRWERVGKKENTPLSKVSTWVRREAWEMMAFLKQRCPLVVENKMAPVCNRCCWPAAELCLQIELLPPSRHLHQGTNCMAMSFKALCVIFLGPFEVLCKCNAKNNIPMEYEEIIKSSHCVNRGVYAQRCGDLHQHAKTD